MPRLLSAAPAATLSATGATASSILDLTDGDAPAMSVIHMGEPARPEPAPSRAAKSATPMVMRGGISHTPAVRQSVVAPDIHAEALGDDDFPQTDY